MDSVMREETLTVEEATERIKRNRERPKVVVGPDLTPKVLSPRHMRRVVETFVCRLELAEDSINVTPAVSFARSNHPRGYANMRIYVRSESGRTMTNSLSVDLHCALNRRFLQDAVECLVEWASETLLSSRERLRTKILPASS